MKTPTAPNPPKDEDNAMKIDSRNVRAAVERQEEEEEEEEGNKGTGRSDSERKGEGEKRKRMKAVSTLKWIRGARR
ncbi:hypothetical protein EYF80_059275 [Liparis tanakae]|uniref:Uncharacterized protein n=1 Tax=Liparis tanakae TaxID=230148 RepID=A0A4Z2EP54_9TELE|nr:hypothetical protein EYF80_059275 [Liparis tanakae]